MAERVRRGCHPKNPNYSSLCKLPMRWCVVSGLGSERLAKEQQEDRATALCLF